MPKWLIPMFQWVLPIGSSIIMCFWPAAMQIGFATTSILALMQAYLLSLPWFRHLIGIHPYPKPVTQQEPSGTMTIPTTARTVPQELGAPAQGLLGGAKSKFKKFIEENQTGPSGGRTKAQLAEAKRYEEKRTREIQREKQMAAQIRQRRRPGKK